MDEEYEVDETAPVLIGSITPLAEYDVAIEIKKRRPIGFLADIDTFVEDE